jgi:arylsulfatase A-like enzyme
VARDEVETVDFFIQRLSEAQEPFMGIYVSFVAHFPYFDYGPDYRVRENDGRLINRYYNNLNLLDQMVKRIYDHLDKEGKLERTIFVIVGDHGQAFGQHHPDNFMHFRYSYNENLECPVILYQPALFGPRAFDFPTSHVDLLPTVLDAMRIPYCPMLFDGESLFQHKLRRKYIFFYGHEESISCLDNDQIKVQYSLKKDRCWAFDLKLDPGEENPLNCSSHKPPLEALQKFVRHHDSSLVDYNASVRENKDFQGYRHPSSVRK